MGRGRYALVVAGVVVIGGGEIWRGAEEMGMRRR
jgi:uridylate kinase